MGMRPLIRYCTTLESGSEFRSPHATIGILGVPGTEVLYPSPFSLCAFITMLSSSFMSMTVWISFTSANSGSQWMCALATRMCWGGRWRPLGGLTSSKMAMPMLSLSMTLFSMDSDPSAWAMASWLNSIR